MLSRSSVESFLVAYFAARRDAAAGAALLPLHAPSASLLVAGRPERQASLDPATYAASHRRAVEAQRAGDPAFPLAGALELASWEADAGGPVGPVGDRGVAWVRHDDPERGASLWVACGLVADGADGAVETDEAEGVAGAEGAGAVRLAWSVLAERPEALEFERGQALGLAEFPALRGQSGRPNRDWLDVAYRRRHRVSRPPLLFLEGARFACQGSGDCCTHMEAHVEPEAQDLIDALPWERIAPELVGTKLTPKGFGQLVLKGSDERCRFLDENERCRIHGYLGTPVFSMCVAFPYRFTETPDGVAVSHSFFCGSVREACGAPLESQTDDIYNRLSLAGAMSTPAVLRLTPERSVDWPTFRDLEAAIRRVLVEPDRPMADRLWIVSRLLEARLAGEEADPVDAARFAAEEPPALDADEADFGESLLTVGFVLIAQLDAAKLASALVPPDGFAWAGTPLRDERFVARWFETLHFSKELAYHFDLVTAHTVTVLLYAAALAIEQAHGGRFPDDVRAALGFVTGHHRLTDLLELACERKPVLRTMLADPAAGGLLLRWLRQQDPRTATI